MLFSKYFHEGISKLDHSDLYALKMCHREETLVQLVDAATINGCANLSSLLARSLAIAVTLCPYRTPCISMKYSRTITDDKMYR